MPDRGQTPAPKPEYRRARSRSRDLKINDFLCTTRGARGPLRADPELAGGATKDTT